VKRDDGVILLVSMQDRKIRIEVGQGLEGVLTDLDSKRIIEEHMVPAFRTGQPSYGILLGSRAIMAKIAPQHVKSEFAALPVRAPARSRELPLPLLLVLIVIAVIGGRLQKRGRYRRFRGYDPSRSAGGWTSGGGGWSGGNGGVPAGGGYSFNGGTLQTNVAGFRLGNGEVSLDLVAVPEPATMSLVATGFAALAGLSAARSRRRSAHTPL
jgi:uncharacterized protein